MSANTNLSHFKEEKHCAKHNKIIDCNRCQTELYENENIKIFVEMLLSVHESRQSRERIYNDTNIKPFLILSRFSALIDVLKCSEIVLGDKIDPKLKDRLTKCVNDLSNETEIIGNILLKFFEAK